GEREGDVYAGLIPTFEWILGHEPSLLGGGDRTYPISSRYVQARPVHVEKVGVVRDDEVDGQLSTISVNILCPDADGGGVAVNPETGEIEEHDIKMRLPSLAVEAESQCVT